MATNALTMCVQRGMADAGFVGSCDIEYPERTTPTATVTFVTPDKTASVVYDMAGKNLADLTGYFCAKLTDLMVSP